MQGWYKSLSLLIFLVLPPAAYLHGAPEDQEFKAAGAAYESGRYLEAGELFTLFARRYPRDPRADSGEFLGATAWIQGGNGEKGLEGLRRHARLFPGSSYRETQAYWTGRARFLLEDWEGASTSFREQARSEKAPDLKDQSRYWWGLSLYRSGKKADAAGIWKEGSLTSLWGQRSRLQAAREYLAAGNYPEALAHLGSLRETSLPKEILHGTLTAQCEVLSRTGDWSGVLVRSGEFLENFPGDPRELEVRLLRASALEKRGRAKEAEEDYRLCLASQDSGLVRKAAFALGALYHRTSRWKESLELWSSLKPGILPPPEEQKRSGNAALAAYRLRKWEEAQSWYVRTAAGPDSTLAGEALIGASTSAFLGGRKKEALDHLKTYLQRHPGAPKREQAAELLFKTAAEAGDPGESLVWLHLLIREFPQSDQLFARRLERSKILTTLEKYPEALEDVQAILDGKASGEVLGEALYQGAFIYARRAEPLRGEKYLFRILEEFPSGELRDRALLARGLAFFNAGQLSPAKASLNRLIRESPESPYIPQAWRHLGQVLDREGNPADSAGAYLQAAKRLSGEPRHQALMDGALQLGKTDPAGALKLWDQLEGETSGITLARVLLHKARSLTDQAKGAQALGSLRKLLDLTGGLEGQEAGDLWQTGALRLSVLLQAQGQNPGELLDVWKRRFPQSAGRKEALLQLSDALLKDRKWAEAAALGRELTQDPDGGSWAEVFRLRQALALGEGDYERSKPLFMEYFRIHGGSAAALGAARSLGALLVRQNREDELDFWIREISGLTPVAAVQTELILSRSRMILDNRWDEGLRLLQGVLRSGASREQKGEALVLLAEGAVRTGRYALAREWIKALPLNSSQDLKGRGRYASGLAFLKEEGSTASLEELSQDRTMDEDTRAKALHEVWKFYREKGDSRAAGVSRRMGELFPGSPWTAKTLPEGDS